MFHIYEGFNLVETYHKMRHQRKYHPADGTKRAIKIALVALVTLLLWNMPSEWFGIQWHPELNRYTAARHRYLCVCYIDVDSRDCFIVGHFNRNHRIDAALLFG